MSAKSLMTVEQFAQMRTADTEDPELVERLGRLNLDKTSAPFPPDIAVEVLSPSQTRMKMESQVNVGQAVSPVLAAPAKRSVPRSSRFHTRVFSEEALFACPPRLTRFRSA